MEELSARQILEKLIGFPTVSRESNLALVDWVEAYLSGHGIRCFRDWSEDRRKASLIAHAGPWEPGAVVLSGHSDVVPVDGQAWRSDPWVLTEREGRLYGRGTCDMKGFVALSIWAMVRARLDGVRRPLQLALSHDEELGCIAAPAMIRAMQDLLPRGDAVIVGEPSRMRIISGHKGGRAFAVTVRGHEVHSSLLPDGISAVMEAARLVQWANERNAENAAKPPSAVAARFHPPFTTLHVGTIRGGTANNITAAECRFLLEMRMMPDEDHEAWVEAFRAEARRLDERLRARHPGAGVEVRPFFAVPALRPEEGGATEALLRALTGENGSGFVSYATEAGQFQNAGYSAAVCGPGDIAQAHQPDEYLELAQFEAGQAFMRRLLDQLGAAD